MEIFKGLDLNNIWKVFLYVVVVEYLNKFK